MNCSPIIIKFLTGRKIREKRNPGLHYCRSGSCCFEVESLYDTSMALVTFCFGSVFGMVTVRMPSSTLAEI